jgi:hypothetical protein
MTTYVSGDFERSFRPPNGRVKSGKADPASDSFRERFYASIAGLDIPPGSTCIHLTETSRSAKGPDVLRY